MSPNNEQIIEIVEYLVNKSLHLSLWRFSRLSSDVTFRRDAAKRLDRKPTRGKKISCSWHAKHKVCNKNWPRPQVSNFPRQTWRQHQGFTSAETPPAYRAKHCGRWRVERVRRSVTERPFSFKRQGTNQWERSLRPLARSARELPWRWWQIHGKWLWLAREALDQSRGQSW